MLRKALAALMLCAACSLSPGAMAQEAGIGSCAGGTLAVTGSSSNVALANCGPSVILYNTTSQEAFYNYGASSSTAATAQSTSTTPPTNNNGSYYIPANSFVTLNIGNLTTAYLAGITATGSTTFRIVQGYALP